MPYPSSDALLEYLGEVGLAPASPSPASFQRRIAAAIGQWEKDTGWRPFLSTGLEEARPFYTADGGFVDFGAGLLSATSVVAASRTLGLGVDFRFTDWSDVAEGLSLLRTASGPIVVTGVWGRVLDLPPQVEEAILAKAALLYVAQSQGGGGELVREKAGPVEYQYSTSSTGGKASTLTSLYDEQVEAWKRRALV